MNVALRRPMTLDEFLAWENRQELRYEFDGFQPIAMTGGTAAHAAIQRRMPATTPDPALHSVAASTNASHIEERS